MEGVESKCRNRSVEESLAIFEEMKKGSETGVRNCLRFKIGMVDANKAMRDPVAYRCNPTHHWRTGDKYKVRPSHNGGSCRLLRSALTERMNFPGASLMIVKANKARAIP